MDDECDDVIRAGSTLPFVQVGMVVQRTDRIAPGGICPMLLVANVYEDDDHLMVATLLRRDGHTSEVTCAELRSGDYRLVHDFDGAAVYTGRWLPGGRAEVERDA